MKKTTTKIAKKVTVDFKSAEKKVILFNMEGLFKKLDEFVESFSDSMKDEFYESYKNRSKDVVEQLKKFLDPTYMDELKIFSLTLDNSGTAVVIAYNRSHSKELIDAYHGYSIKVKEFEILGLAGKNQTPGVVTTNCGNV